MMNRCWSTITTIAFLSTIVAAVVLACSSTSEDFRVRTLTVNVQPSQPVLVQRFQAPELRVFCFSTVQISGVSSAACPATTGSAMVLCSRRADQPDATATCETFVAITGETQRGSINGPDIIWDVMWDGTKLSPQCFPRGVQFSYLALVRGAEVASVALFVVLLLIALLAFVMGICSMGVFVRQKYYIFDAAGATSIGGPKGDFAGHQMQVRAGAAEEAQTMHDGTVPTVYLPVRAGGTDADLYGAEGADDLTDAQRAEMNAQNAMHNASGGAASRAIRPIALKGASPPRPGDGIEGFEGASREMGFEEGAFGGRGVRGLDGIGGSSGKYRDGPPSSIRRRRGYKPHGAGDKYGADGETSQWGPGGRRNKALFPTHYDWEKNDGDGFDDDSGRGPNERFDRDSSGAYLDENGNTYSSRAGQPGVRYIPQWMHAFHGRDENDAAASANSGVYDGQRGDGLNNSSVHALPEAVPIGKSRGVEVSELGKYNTKPKRAGGGGGAAGGDDAGYESGNVSDGPGGRRVKFQDGKGPGGKGGGRGGTPGSGRTTPNQRGAGNNNSRRGGGGGPSGGEAFGSGSGGGRRVGGAGADRGGENAEGDRFNRGRAHVFSDSMSLKKDAAGRSMGGTGPDRTDVVRNFGPVDDMNTTSLAQHGPRPVLQCAHCKTLLDGDAARFCPVTGETHQ